MHERIIDLYERHAKAWDEQRRGGAMESAWLDRFTQQLPEQAASSTSAAAMASRSPAI